MSYRAMSQNPLTEYLGTVHMSQQICGLASVVTLLLIAASAHLSLSTIKDECKLHCERVDTDLRAALIGSIIG